MDKNRCEVFGEFTYAESLTYDDLLACENALLERLDEIFLDAGAEHLDFTPLGDILMLQCSFFAQNLEIFRDVADEIAGSMPDGVSGRLLCLEKNLASFHCFWLRQGLWQEKEYILPAQGPDDSPARKVALLTQMEPNL